MQASSNRSIAGKRLSLKKLSGRYPVGTVLVLLFALVCLSPLMALRDLTPANELRYLSITDEAIADGHVFAFTNHGVPYADKPPLYFWLMMLCRVIFGRHCIYVLSLFSFIPAAVVTLVMDRWVYARRDDALPRERTAMALMLCSTVYWLGLSFFLRMDMLMTMFIVLALFAWHRVRPWQFALFTFLALFTKGPVGILMPPVVLLTYIISCRKRDREDPRMRPLRFLGWRFLLLVGGCCAVWFFGAWLDGGSDYLRNLLFHQTVDRTINASHHREPFWFYLVQLWPVMLPWCLLTIPACVASLVRRGETASPRSSGARSEKLFRCAFFATVVMLSLSSSKLPVYLLPVVPFAVYLLPLYVHRTGWRRWMDITIGVSGALFALLGLILALMPVLQGRIAALAPYGFLTSVWFVVAGVLVLVGGALTAFLAFGEGRHMNGIRFAGGQQENGISTVPGGRHILAIRPLALAVPLFFLALAPLMPQLNEFLGYGALCRDIPANEKVYVKGHNRPENMDVYLGRQVTVLQEGDPLPSDGVLVTKATFSDPALQGRPRRPHGESVIWLPAGSSD